VCSAHGGKRWLDVSKGEAELHAFGAARVWLSLGQCGVGLVGPNRLVVSCFVLFPFSF
jgi:hypothetical protein